MKISYSNLYMNSMINLIFRPYNDQISILNHMIFDDLDNNLKLQNMDNKSVSTKWQRISDYILKSDGKTLRKQMKYFNRGLYSKCEEMSANITRLTVKRSYCRNMQYYKMKSIAEKKGLKIDDMNMRNNENCGESTTRMPFHSQRSYSEFQTQDERCKLF